MRIFKIRKALAQYQSEPPSPEPPAAQCRQPQALKEEQEQDITTRNRGLGSHDNGPTRWARERSERGGGLRQVLEVDTGEERG